ncbi:inositol monophosphatase [bacterium]|nr:inositol monophosphatase [bacterium]
MFEPIQHEQIIHILQSTAEFQLQERNKLKDIEHKEKGLNQLVSHVDVESERMVVNGLQHLTPDAAFITEEETVEQSKAKTRWIIDPLDGTTNYLFGLDQFCISIAFQEEGITKYGGIYLPVGDQYYYSLGDGAYLNQERIQISDRSDLKSSLLATGFPYYDFTEIKEYLYILHDLMKETKGLRRMGSAAIDLAYTAEGRFDAFFELNLSPWDVAAGAFIVEQAGGKVFDFKGGDDYIFGRSIMASNNKIDHSLLSLIQSHMP